MYSSLQIWKREVQRAKLAPCTTMDGSYMMKKRGLDVREKRAAVRIFLERRQRKKFRENHKIQNNLSFMPQLILGLL
jgi:hypothetical protein